MEIISYKIISGQKPRIDCNKFTNTQGGIKYEQPSCINAQQLTG